MSKGVDETKKETWNAERENKNDKPRVFFLKKVFFFVEKGENCRIGGNTFYVLQIITPLSQNCRENGVSCHNVKATQQTQAKQRKTDQNK